MRIAQGAKDCSSSTDAQSSADRRTGRTPDDKDGLEHCQMRGHKRTRKGAWKPVDGGPSTRAELHSWSSALDCEEGCSQPDAVPPPRLRLGGRTELDSAAWKTLSWRGVKPSTAEEEAVSQMLFCSLVFDVVAAERNWTAGLGKRSPGVE